MSGFEDWKNKNILVRVAVLLGLGWIFFCMLFAIFLMICTGIAGYRFLPSSEWVASIGRWDIAMGGGTALLFLLFARFSISLQLDKGMLKPGWRPTLSIVFSPFIGYLVGSMAGGMAWPMMLALVAGHHEELAYTVGRADKYYERYCYSPLKLQGLMTDFDEVCGVSDEFRKGLTTGTRVIVAGHGTRYGLFVTELRRSG